MTPAKKRAAAKKTAAPPPEPMDESTPEDVPEGDALLGVGTIEASGSVGVAEPAVESVVPPQQDRLGPFPLLPNNYFHPQVVSPSAHWGETQSDSAYLRALQDVLGASPTGVYDDETERVVVAWKEAHSMPASPVVDEETWRGISEG